jgi:geranylgeranyl diphosphate synthase type II
MLVSSSCGLCGGNPDEARSAAAAVEALHNFTLIHDDIMDQANTRRGFETVHKRWNESTAILSGDSLFAYAFGALRYYAFSDNYSKKQLTDLMDTFISSTAIVCDGQALDMEFASRNDVSLDEYIKMISWKTAALLSASMRMGAIVAGADEQKTLDVAEIGRLAGIAFQIQDDLLDATADPEKFGKRPGGDIIEGKKTYLLISALEKAKNDDLDILKSIPGKHGITDSEVQSVIHVMDRVGVLETTRKEIESLYEQALSLLEKFPDSEYRIKIKSLLNQLTVREN